MIVIAEITEEQISFSSQKFAFKKKKDISVLLRMNALLALSLY